MSNQFTHNCIKCKTPYQDTDSEAYLCASCNELRLAIAKEVDAKLAMRPKKPAKSDFKIAETMGKTIPSAMGGGLSTFVKASDLGITFD